MLVLIDLSSNQIHGPIPSSIFKLTQLQNLILSFNKFNGTIRLDMIQDLTSLMVLDLSYNNLSIEGSGNASSIISLPFLFQAPQRIQFQC